MNYSKATMRICLPMLAGCLGLWDMARRAEAAANPSVPAVVQDGFAAWGKGGSILAFDTWPKGGLLEESRKAASQCDYFKRLDRALGNYRSYELVESKAIGSSSQILYLAMSFERGAVYARFLVYRTEKGWVVQDMDFSTKPETIMPWLAFQPVNYAE